MIRNSSAPLDFYGDSSHWFMITTAIFGLYCLLSNLLLLWIAISSTKIRSVTANLFTINLAIGNVLFGSFYAFLQPIVLRFGEAYPILCQICGMGNIAFAFSFLFTPTLMAACRFYHVSRMPASNFNWFISRAFFTKSGALALLFICWSYGIVFCSFFALTDQLGEDPNGFCAAKAFSSTALYVLYNLGLIFFALSTAILTFVYYNRLRKFLAEHNTPFDQTSQDTRSFMRLVAITAILPLICNSPTLLLTGGQWFIPTALPMWIRRAFVLPVFLPSMAVPWLTISLLRPFRRQFAKKILRRSASLVLDRDMQEMDDF